MNYFTTVNDHIKNFTNCHARNFVKLDTLFICSWYQKWEAALEVNCFWFISLQKCGPWQFQTSSYLQMKAQIIWAWNVNKGIPQQLLLKEVQLNNLYYNINAISGPLLPPLVHTGWTFTSVIGYTYHSFFQFKNFSFMWEHCWDCKTNSLNNMQNSLTIQTYTRIYTWLIQVQILEL